MQDRILNIRVLASLGSVLFNGSWDPAHPLQESPGPFEPEIPEESPKESPGASRPQGPKVSETVSKESPETQNRLF